MSGGLDLGESNLMDGLQQSDLEYLARLGGDPHGPAGHHPETSMDEHPVVLEPGAPAGTARAWGDRQPWGKAEGPKEDRTGLDVLRERQQREAEKGQQEREREQQGQQGDLLRQSAGVRMSGAGAGQLAPLPAVLHGQDADLVLLGETLSPGERVWHSPICLFVKDGLSVYRRGRLRSGLVLMAWLGCGYRSPQAPRVYMVHRLLYCLSNSHQLAT